MTIVPLAYLDHNNLKRSSRMINDVAFGSDGETTEICVDAFLEVCEAFGHYTQTSLHLDLHPAPSHLTVIQKPDAECESLAAEILLEYAFQVCGDAIGFEAESVETVSLSNYQWDSVELADGDEDLPSRATLVEEVEHIGFLLAQFPQPPSFFAKTESTKSGYGKRHGVIFDFPRAERELW